MDSITHDEAPEERGTPSDRPAATDEQGNYEGVSGGERTAQSGDPEAEQRTGEEKPAGDQG